MRREGEKQKKQRGGVWEGKGKGKGGEGKGRGFCLG